MTITNLYARLANHQTTEKALFEGDFTGISNIKLSLSPLAAGQALVLIQQNNTTVLTQTISAGQNVSYAPTIQGSTVGFYVDSYNQSDLAQLFVNVS